MAAIVWDKTGDRLYETGTDHGVLYLLDNTGKYSKGYPWNGLTAVTESPEGAEPTDLWADNIKYASMRSAETFGMTIEAYTCPPEFFECDGFAELGDGVRIGQQPRKTFGFSYRTNQGNDVTDELGYKLHLVYGCVANPSEKAYSTINDSPDAVSLSWDIDTNPVNVTGHKPTAVIIIDSTKVDPDALVALEKVLYGDGTTEPRLPLPDEVVTIVSDSGSL